MNLSGRLPTFRKREARSNPYRMLIWLVLLIPAIYLFRGLLINKQIKSPFESTQVPTRTSASYVMEGATHFAAGNLPSAIAAYQSAARLDPKNATIFTELARIQTYSSASLSTDAQKAARLQEALESINQAVALAPEDSNAHAIRAFVLDWNANPVYVGDRVQSLLAEAEQEASRALALDNKNILALAYYAEILVDEQRLSQAEQIINQALEKGQSLMDVHRVDGYLKESSRKYSEAITAYQEAVKITPNLTFLYSLIGTNYRQLKRYDQALEYYAKAANINKQLGIQDPIPYLAIGKTYAQQGNFLVASRNVEKVLEFDPTNPDIYGTLGMIYFQARNYEGAIPALKCATIGCSAEESCGVRSCDAEKDAAIVVPGMDLTTNTVVYYYTYGSVLAGMQRPSNKYCIEALQILGLVRNKFASDTTIMQIVKSSENICADFGYTP